MPVDSKDSQPQSHANAETSLGEHLPSHESTTLVDAVQTWSYGVDDRQRGFFLARRHRGESTNCNWQIASLSQYEDGFFTGIAPENCYVCFADPSNYENAPGWMLRNLLVLVKRRWGLNEVQIIRYRDVHAKRDQGRSIVIRLKSNPEPGPDNGESQKAPMQTPKITGWERNPAGKLSGRMVNLTEYMDPTR